VKISGYMYKFQGLTPISGHFRNFRTTPRPVQVSGGRILKRNREEK